jgi:hypothetical protein
LLTYGDSRETWFVVQVTMRLSEFRNDFVNRLQTDRPKGS